MKNSHFVHIFGKLEGRLTVECEEMGTVIFLSLVLQSLLPETLENVSLKFLGQVSDEEQGSVTSIIDPIFVHWTYLLLILLV